VLRYYTILALVLLYLCSTLCRYEKEPGPRTNLMAHALLFLVEYTESGWQVQLYNIELHGLYSDACKENLASSSSPPPLPPPLFDIEIEHLLEDGHWKQLCCIFLRQIESHGY